MYSSLEDFASTRKKAVYDGLESAELAALLVEKFAEGIESTGNAAIQQADKLCAEIDLNYKENRKLRYKKVARLDLTQPRK
jgi:hypothetical protein